MEGCPAVSLGTQIVSVSLVIVQRAQAQELDDGEYIYREEYKGLAHTLEVSGLDGTLLPFIAPRNAHIFSEQANNPGLHPYDRKDDLLV
jgi:hypothetical protein